MSDNVRDIDISEYDKTFTHCGIKCRTMMGFYSLNGYVYLPENHPWLEKPHTQPHDYLPGGRFTYQQENVLGFDTAHWPDKPHPDSRYMQQLRLRGEEPEPLFLEQLMYGRVWTLDDVEELLRRLAELAARAYEQVEAV